MNKCASNLVHKYKVRSRKKLLSLDKHSSWKKICENYQKRPQISVRQYRSLDSYQINAKTRQKYYRVMIGAPTSESKQKFQENCQNNKTQKKFLIFIFQQKMKLMSELKRRIDLEHNNWLNKKVISEVNYMGAAKIIQYLWKSADQYIESDEDKLNELENKLKFVMNYDIIKSIDTVNNIAKFLYTDYRHKLWKQKQNHLALYNNQNMHDISKISSKLYRIDNKKTRENLNKTVNLLVKENKILANKHHYNKLKQNGKQLLLKQARGCEILRADLFSEDLYDTGNNN